MSDAAPVQKLGLTETIKDGFNIGIKNLGPILVNVILWVLTVWIPYLNVGTTIGLAVGIVTKASKGEVISFTEIFDSKYRKYMGEFFLTGGLVGMGTAVGTALFIIPGIIIGIAWSLALLLVIDKGKNPTEAITLSNNLTYGYKAKMFGIYFLPILVISIVAIILAKIPAIGILLALAAYLFILLLAIGLEASIYKQLAGDA